MKNSLTAMYKLAKTHLDDEEYEEAKEILEFILDFPHANKQIIENAEKLLENVILLEEISLLLTEAETAKDNKEYEEALSFINEARDLKEIDDISSVFDAIMDDILDEAQAAYLKNEFEKATNLYTLLEKHDNSPESETDYQATIQQLENLQIIQDKYELETIDVNQDSLFNQLLDGNEDTQNSSDVVNNIKSYINQNEEENVQFIFDIDINELATGGQ